MAVLGNKVIVGGSFMSIGGLAATNLAQWDGTNWAQEHPAHAPPARARPAMTYHAPSERVVLFGGNVLPASHSARSCGCTPSTSASLSGVPLIASARFKSRAEVCASR